MPIRLQKRVGTSRSVASGGSAVVIGGDRSEVAWNCRERPRLITCLARLCRLGHSLVVMRVPTGLMKIAKETLRHLLRRPVVGIVAVAQTADGRVLLIRRGDTGQWALPGGTLEWGETLRNALPRELWEEAGARVIKVGHLVGVYSAPERDPRFHAVTVVVRASIEEPSHPPDNSVEILEVGLFAPQEIPKTLSHGNKAMLDNALGGAVVWE